VTRFLQIGDVFLNIDHIVKVVEGVGNEVKTSDRTGCIESTRRVVRVTIYHDVTTIFPCTEFSGEDAERVLRWLSNNSYMPLLPTEAALDPEPSLQDAPPRPRRIRYYSVRRPPKCDECPIVNRCILDPATCWRS
jgi:hypothetical protein